MGTSEEEKNVSLQVDLSPRSRAVIDNTKKDFGVAKVEAVTRIMEWFAAQPKSVRREIIERDGDPSGELVRLRMAEMGAGATPGDVPGLKLDEAVAAAHAAVERVAKLAAAYREQLGATVKRKK